MVESLSKSEYNEYICFYTPIRKEGCLLPEYSSSGRDPRRASGERPVRSASRPQSSARPATRSGASRPQGGAPRSGAARPQGSRAPQGARPSGNRPPQGRRPAPRRKKRTQPRFFIILGIIAIALIVTLILIFSGGKGGDAKQPMATPVPVESNAGMSNATINSQPGAAAADPAVATGNDGAAHSTLQDWLADEDAEMEALSADEMVKVQDLSVNTSLPKDWTNILLLGTDQRTLTESCRTDAMIICSINPGTGEVKLTSIMRDLAVKFDDIGKYNGTYRINAANYFGGPEYAIKTVNECFDMNIEHYVMVNFFGFQRIAQALGGIEVNVSQAEMEEINRIAVEQAWIGFHAGIDESDQINEYLTTFGENTHLNGRQTLAYARVRHTDSDFSRADRQRTVLVKLLEKLKGKSAAEIIALAGSMSSNVSTNMNINDIVEVALQVVQSGLSSVDMLRLPMNETYTLEKRNDDAMFYDCDWKTNALELYNFIYE